MKPTDREQKFTLLSWSTAVLTCLLTCSLGGFVGFYAGPFLLLFGGGQQGYMDMYSGLVFSIIGALLGIVCGAAVGLRIVRSFPDREQKFTLLSWSTAVLTGLLGGFVGFWAALFLPFFLRPRPVILARMVFSLQITTVSQVALPGEPHSSWGSFPSALA